MKKIIIFSLFISSLISFVACQKETAVIQPSKIYLWDMGELNSSYELNFVADDDRTYNFSLKDNSLCPNNTISLSVDVNTKNIVKLDTLDKSFKTNLVIKKGDAIKLKTTLVDLGTKIACFRLGNLGCTLQ